MSSSEYRKRLHRELAELYWTRFPGSAWPWAWRMAEQHLGHTHLDLVEMEAEQRDPIEAAQLVYDTPLT